MDIAAYDAWRGRTETLTERLDGWPVRGLQALLDTQPDAREGSIAPALAQWLWFAPMVPRSQVDTDGHPRRGGFLPPVALPRRMWAGSDIRFHAPMTIGATVRKTMTIDDIALKQGSSGPLVFVRVHNAYASADDDALLLDETQILVYRDPPGTDEPAPRPRPAPEDPAWSSEIAVDAAMMFRYSAVTFNAHRIHYDSDYSRDVEGYPAILVQGQLGATLMIEALLARTGGQRPASFSFRGVQPIHVDEPVVVEGSPTADGWNLWIRDTNGMLRMTARTGG